MATTGRYFYTPCKTKRYCHRTTLVERIRRWNARRHQQTPDMMIVTGYFMPIYPRR